jgi:hypothetical protein
LAWFFAIVLVKKMREFNLEQALAGHPVQTRDGRPVTQLTKFDLPEKGVFRLVGVTSGQHIETWSPNGNYEFNDYGLVDYSWLDLFMAPVKKTGWVARYEDFVGAQAYQTEEESKHAYPSALSYHEISWEE